MHFAAEGQSLSASSRWWIGAKDGCNYHTDGSDSEELSQPYKFSATVAAAARDDEDFGPLALSKNWERKEPDPKQWVWTDDYSDIVGAVVRQINGE